jgi:hypothetical protein
LRHFLVEKFFHNSSPLPRIPKRKSIFKGQSGQLERQKGTSCIFMVRGASDGKNFAISEDLSLQEMPDPQII